MPVYLKRPIAPRDNPTPADLLSADPNDQLPPPWKSTGEQIAPGTGTSLDMEAISSLSFEASPAETIYEGDALPAYLGAPPADAPLHEGVRSDQLSPHEIVGILPSYLDAAMAIGAGGTTASLTPRKPNPPVGPEKNLSVASNLTPSEQSLLDLARKAAPALVVLRFLTAEGDELARYCGCVVDATGTVLTDLAYLDSEADPKLAYVEATTGEGKTYRVAGAAEPYETLAIVRLARPEGRETSFLRLKVEALDPRQSSAAVAIVSFNEKRGISLIEADAPLDSVLGGDGWLDLHGKFAGCAPGSPVLNAQGEVLAIVGSGRPATAVR